MKTILIKLPSFSKILMPNKLFKLIFPSLILIITGTIYFLTLSPYLQPGDSTEMVTAATVLGVPHQPSFPLNTLIGHLFYLSPLPLTDIGKINSAASVIQILSIITFYFLILEILSQENPQKNFINHLCAFVSSLFLAFSLIFWQYSVKFEVFALNNLFVILSLLLSFKILRLFNNQKKYLVPLSLLFFIFGLAITHHQTIILIFPSLVIILFPVIRSEINIIKINIKLFAIRYLLLTFFLVLGILPYFIILISIAHRDPLLNWGHVKDLSGALRAIRRTDYGTFSAFLSESAPANKAYPLDHIKAYLNSIFIDYTIIGIIFILVGLYSLYRRYKKILIIVITGIIISGFIFLSWAGFPLEDSFNQATAKRFYMLPNIYLAIILAFGVNQISLILHSLQKTRHRHYGLYLGFIYLSLSFFYPIYMNYSTADHSTNNLTELFIQNAYQGLPRDSMVLLSGDIPDMTADYFRLVMVKEPDRKMFTPGQLHLDWFKRDLLEYFPDMLLPPPEPGKRFTTAKQFALENYGKYPIYIFPELIPNAGGIEDAFVLYPDRIMFLVKAKGEDLKIEDWQTENERIFNSLDLKLIAQIRQNSPNFEESIVFYFARYFYNSGHVYEEVGLFENAIIEYNRSLSIIPNFKESYTGLARSNAKSNPPNFEKAIESLRHYQSLLKPEEYENGQAAEALINQYQEQFEQYINTLNNPEQLEPSATPEDL